MKQACVYCKSEIDSECYVCPVCRKWIQPFRLKKNNPIMKIMIGFTLLYVVIFGVQKFIFNHYFLEKFNLKEFKSAELSGLEIISQRIEKANGGTYIIGEVKNTGTDSFSSLQVEASMYDKDEKLVDVESNHIMGNVKPGDVRGFKIARCCVKDNESVGLGEFDKFKLVIVNGIYSYPDE